MSLPPSGSRPQVTAAALVAARDEPVPPVEIPAGDPSSVSEAEPSAVSPAAQRALAEAAERRAAREAEALAVQNRPATEIGGRDGPDPVRYGDWEKGGIAWDF